MATIKKLTPSVLKRIIREEKAKLKEKITSDTVEDAWAGGDNLVNQINFIKKLGIKEVKYINEAKRLREARKKLSKLLKLRNKLTKGSK